jgi:polar amino acid transport system permease protein
VASVLEYWPSLMRGLATTVWIALASIFGAAVGSLVLGTLKLSRSRARRRATGAFIEVVRGASALVLLFWVFYALPLVPGAPHLTPTAASILVLSLIGAAYGAEIVRGGIESVHKGQSDACHALGFTPAQSLRLVILPQALSQIVPAFGSLAADMIKWTSIVSFVGVQDVLYVANSVRSVTYETVTVFTLLAALYWGLCLVSGALFKLLERFLPLNRALQATAQSRVVAVPASVNAVPLEARP